MQVTRRVLVTVIVLAAWFAVPGHAATSKNYTLSPGKSGTISFSTPIQFGQQLLPAGDYEFRCIHKGNYHLMAAYRAPSNPSRSAVVSGKPVATNYCRMEALPEKSWLTSATTTNVGSGKAVLKEIRIQGEQVRHIFDEPLQLEPLDPVKAKSAFELLKLLIATGGRP